MKPLLQEFVSNAMTIASPAVGLWLGIWGLRRKLGSDYKLDKAERAVRWTVVLTCWIIGSLPGRAIGPVAAVAVVAGLAFLWWPNCAHHLMRLLHRTQAESENQHPAGFRPRGREEFTLLNLHDPRPPQSRTPIRRRPNGWR